MAIFHCDVKIIARSTSATTITAKAAYRSGTILHDATTGETYDYTRKRGIYDSEILLPENAPQWMRDREKLWVAVEQKEDQSTRRNKAQLARELILALPTELEHDHKQSLVRGYVQEQFVQKGMVADVAYHDFNKHNPHAHVLLTMREVSPEGFGKKNRRWNDRALVKQWRESWANHVNRELEREGHSARVDHRSLKDRGIDREPQIHLGPHVIQLETMGIRTEVGDTYRAIAAANQNRIRQQQEQLQTDRKRQQQLSKSSQQIIAGVGSEPGTTHQASADKAPSTARDIPKVRSVEPHSGSLASSERSVTHNQPQSEKNSETAKPGSSEASKTGENNPSPGHYGKFFTAAIRYDLGRDYQPAYSAKLDPDNHQVPSTGEERVDPGEGNLDPDLLLALEKVAGNSVNGRKQVERAHWFRMHPEIEQGEFWEQRGGYWGTPRIEYLKELSRQAEVHGDAAVLSPKADQNMAVRMRAAGFSWNQIYRAVTEESPVATSLPSTEHQSAYLEQVIKPTLQQDSVKDLKTAVDQDKNQRGIQHEQRLERLGLATEGVRELRLEREGELGR